MQYPVKMPTPDPGTVALVQALLALIDTLRTRIRELETPKGGGLQFVDVSWDTPQVLYQD
jgi:hypothetical protein